MGIHNVASNQNIKVIYCMGSGRSGSTLFGIILGSHPDVVNPGELYTIHKISKPSYNCSCGKRVEDCEYWAEVISKWKIECGEETVKRTLARLKAMENFKSPKAWIKAIFNNPRKSTYYDEYLKSMYTLLKLIIEKRGKSVLVDISKNPLRAFLLMKHPNIDLRLIHLVRDGRGVSWSLYKHKDKRKPIWRAALFWTIINRQSNYVQHKAVNSIRIHYEDLVAHPESTLKKIAQISEIDPKPLLKVVNGELANEDSHIMAGNLLRRKKAITLKMDREWQEKLDPKKQRLFLMMAKRTMKKMGYH